MNSPPAAKSADRNPDVATIKELIAVVGEGHVHTAYAERYAYARDRLPYATFCLREGRLPGAVPAAVVSPASHEEVAAVVRLARARKLKLIPFGAGSGVLGGAIPLGNEVIVDLKRLNRIVRISRLDHTVEVEAGMNGGQFEAALLEQGFTCGHYPQSLHMSTVGGWAACRSAGQASTRYGSIEEMVLGMRAVLPDGSTLDVRAVPRRAVGPSVLQLIIGSEGAFGIITSLTLRILRRPSHVEGVVVTFPAVGPGLDALRELMQSGLRPAVVRLYDETESLERARPLAAFNEGSCLCIMEFAGSERMVALEKEMVLDIARRFHGQQSLTIPYERWLETRFQSYSPEWHSSGYYMDTIEVTGCWSTLPRMYADMRAAVRALHPDVHFGAHWSHIYPEGACQYMTVRLPPMPFDLARPLHHRAWDVIQRTCLQHGGSISHHHGIGFFRNQWIGKELNVGLTLLRRLKDVIDPDHVFNPGKLGLSTPAAVSKQ